MKEAPVIQWPVESTRRVRSLDKSFDLSQKDHTNSPDRVDIVNKKEKIVMTAKDVCRQIRHVSRWPVLMPDYGYSLWHGHDHFPGNAYENRKKHPSTAIHNKESRQHDDDEEQRPRAKPESLPSVP